MPDDSVAWYEEAPRREREEALRRSRGAALAALEDGRVRDALDMLMASAAGRTFLRWLLARCRCFEAQSPGRGDALAERLIFAEGGRQVGMRLLERLQAANPAHFPTLLLTREDDDDPGC